MSLNELDPLHRAHQKKYESLFAYIHAEIVFSWDAPTSSYTRFVIQQEFYRLTEKAES